MNFNLINLKSNGKKKKNNEKFSKKKVLHAVGGRLRLDNCGNDLFNLELHTSFLANLFMRKILDFTHKLAKKSTFFNFDSFILGLKKKNIKYFLDLKFSSYLFNKNFNLSESISTHILERAVVLYAFKKKKNRLNISSKKDFNDFFLSNLVNLVSNFSNSLFSNSDLSIIENKKSLLGFFYFKRSKVTKFWFINYLSRTRKYEFLKNFYFNFYLKKSFFSEKNDFFSSFSHNKFYLKNLFLFKDNSSLYLNKNNIFIFFIGRFLVNFFFNFQKLKKKGRKRKSFKTRSRRIIFRLKKGLKKGFISNPFFKPFSLFQDSTLFDDSTFFNNVLKEKKDFLFKNNDKKELTVEKSFFNFNFLNFFSFNLNRFLMVKRVFLFKKLSLPSYFIKDGEESFLPYLNHLKFKNFKKSFKDLGNFLVKDVRLNVVKKLKKWASEPGIKKSAKFFIKKKKISVKKNIKSFRKLFKIKKSHLFFNIFLNEINNLDIGIEKECDFLIYLDYKEKLRRLIEKKKDEFLSEETSKWTDEVEDLYKSNFLYGSFFQKLGFRNVFYKTPFFRRRSFIFFRNIDRFFKRKLKTKKKHKKYKKYIISSNFWSKPIIAAKGSKFLYFMRSKSFKDKLNFINFIPKNSLLKELTYWFYNKNYVKRNSLFYYNSFLPFLFKKIGFLIPQKKPDFFKIFSLSCKFNDKIKEKPIFNYFINYVYCLKFFEGFYLKTSFKANFSFLTFLDSKILTTLFSVNSYTLFKFFLNKFKPSVKNSLILIISLTFKSLIKFLDYTKILLNFRKLNSYFLEYHEFSFEKNLKILLFGRFNNLKNIKFEKSLFHYKKLFELSLKFFSFKIILKYCFGWLNSLKFKKTIFKEKVIKTRLGDKIKIRKKKKPKFSSFFIKFKFSSFFFIKSLKRKFYKKRFYKKKKIRRRKVHVNRRILLMKKKFNILYNSKKKFFLSFKNLKIKFLKNLRNKKRVKVNLKLRNIKRFFFDKFYYKFNRKEESKKFIFSRNFDLKIQKNLFFPRKKKIFIKRRRYSLRFLFAQTKKKIRLLRLFFIKKKLSFRKQIWRKTSFFSKFLKPQLIKVGLKTGSVRFKRLAKLNNLKKFKFYKRKLIKLKFCNIEKLRHLNKLKNNRKISRLAKRLKLSYKIRKPLNKLNPVLSFSNVRFKTPLNFKFIKLKKLHSSFHFFKISSVQKNLEEVLNVRVFSLLNKKLNFLNKDKKKNHFGFLNKSNLFFTNFLKQRFSMVQTFWKEYRFSKNTFFIKLKVGKRNFFVDFSKLGGLTLFSTSGGKGGFKGRTQVSQRSISSAGKRLLNFFRRKNLGSTRSFSELSEPPKFFFHKIRHTIKKVLKIETLYRILRSSKRRLYSKLKPYRKLKFSKKATQFLNFRKKKKLKLFRFKKIFTLVRNVSLYKVVITNKDLTVKQFMKMVLVYQNFRNKLSRKLFLKFPTPFFKLKKKRKALKAHCLTYFGFTDLKKIGQFLQRSRKKKLLSKKRILKLKINKGFRRLVKFTEEKTFKTKKEDFETFNFLKFKIKKNSRKIKYSLIFLKFKMMLIKFKRSKKLKRKARKKKRRKIKFFKRISSKKLKRIISKNKKFCFNVRKPFNQKSFLKILRKFFRTSRYTRLSIYGKFLGKVNLFVTGLKKRSNFLGNTLSYFFFVRKFIRFKPVFLKKVPFGYMRKPAGRRL